MRTRAKVALGALPALVALGVVFGAYWYWSEPPQPATSYYGVVLHGDGKPEVHYKLGVPPRVFGGPDPSGGLQALDVGPLGLIDARKYPATALARGTDFENYRIWSYPTPGRDSDLLISFNEPTGKVDDIACFSSAVAATACTPLLGVRIGDSEDSVRNRLGSPDHESIDPHSGAKTITYRRLRAEFELARQTVFAMRASHF